MKRLWIVLGGIVLLTLAVLAMKYLYESRDELALVAPTDYVDSATRIAELQHQGRSDEAIDAAVQALRPTRSSAKTHRRRAGTGTTTRKALPINDPCSIAGGYHGS